VLRTLRASRRRGSSLTLAKKNAEARNQVDGRLSLLAALAPWRQRGRERGSSTSWS